MTKVVHRTLGLQDEVTTEYNIAFFDGMPDHEKMYFQKRNRF